MVLGLGGCGHGGKMYLANKGVREEATGNYCIVCYREAFL